MSGGDTPTISSSSRSSTIGGFGGASFSAVAAGLNLGGADRLDDDAIAVVDYTEQLLKGQQMTMRVVQVFIADPNENLALEKRLLYRGDEKLTDLTDQELYFDLPIGELLATHNAVRAKTVDKKASEKFGREIFLEPVRVRDLKMVVVNVAQF